MRIVRILMLLSILVLALGYVTGQYADTHMHFEPVGSH